MPDRQVGQSGKLADTTGVLQAVKVKDLPNANMDIATVGVPSPVEWVTVDFPDHDDDTDSTRMATRFQAQAKGAAVPWGRGPAVRQPHAFSAEVARPRGDALHYAVDRPAASRP